MSTPTPHHEPAQDYPPAGGQLPAVSRVSPALYVGGVWILAGLGGGLTRWAISHRAVSELLMVSSLPLLLGGILSLVLLYKAWAAIRDGYTTPTPGMAVGLLFIPVFNIFWMFIAVAGWASKFNAFADRHRIDGFRASGGLFVAHCVLALIPYVNVVTVVTGTLIMIEWCKGINAVADRRAGNLPVAIARPK